MKVTYHVTLNDLYYGDPNDNNYNPICLAANRLHGDDTCALKDRFLTSERTHPKHARSRATTEETGTSPYTPEPTKRSRNNSR